MNPYGIPEGKIDSNILKYVGAHPVIDVKLKIPFPAALRQKIQEPTAEERSEITSQFTQNVTQHGTTTTKTIPWSGTSVTKKEADQFKNLLSVQNPISKGSEPGPLALLILSEKDQRMAVNEFLKLEDRTLPNNMVLFAGEQCAIWLYTHATYGLLNGTLSHNAISLRRWMKEQMKLDPNAEASKTFLAQCQKEVPLIANMAMSGINKLPPCMKTLYRGDAMPKEQLEGWKKGKFVVTQKLFSCSTKGYVAEEFSKGTAILYMKETHQEHKPVLYVIGAENAKSIADYSVWSGEGEYVYPPEQLFYSVGVDEKTIPGLAIIYLQEVC